MDDGSSKNYVDVEWRLYDIRSQIQDLIWMVIKMDSNKDILDEGLEVQNKLDGVTFLLIPQPTHSNKYDHFIASGL